MALPSIRIIGTPEQVETIAAELRAIFEIERESKDYAARKQPGQVMRYLTIRRAKGAR